MLSVLRFIQVCESTFPIGTYTLSNGLETYIQHKNVYDEITLEHYAKNYLQLLPFNDLGIMVLAQKNATDEQFLVTLDKISNALKASFEVRSSTKKLCNRFLNIVAEFGYDLANLNAYKKNIQAKNAVGIHPIALGIFAHDICVENFTAANIYAYSLLNSVVINGVKMIPLSQKSGQKILSKIEKKIIDAAKFSQKIELKNLGVNGTSFDISCMEHEELYSRLYMS